MDTFNYYIEGFKRYVDFTSRSSRKQYWYFLLWDTIVSMVIGIVSAIVFSGMGTIWSTPLIWAYDLIIIIPSISLGIRRLHDIGKSGWWMLISIIPLIGAIILIVWAIKAGDPGANAYGPSPLEEAVPTSSESPQP